MSNFPSVKAKEFIKVIEKLGFYFDRQKESNIIYTLSTLCLGKGRIPSEMLRT
jgi:predicted RNA binding protein YcfA (HicA-like mRNA interferase family)